MDVSFDEDNNNIENKGNNYIEKETIKVKNKKKIQMHIQ